MAINRMNWNTVEAARAMYEAIGLCYECALPKDKCICDAKHEAACAKVDALLGDEPVGTIALINTAEILEHMDGCSCNGTEAVACAYCREQAKTKEIPY